MIFKTEINPRDYDGYYGMIGHLLAECLKTHGATFDTTKIAMGQITPNSDMCWFEGLVDDEAIAKVTKEVAFRADLKQAIAFLNANGYKVINMNEQPRQQIIPESPNSLKWRNADMMGFGEYCLDRAKEMGYMNIKESFEKWQKIRMAASGNDCLPGGFQP